LKWIDVVKELSLRMRGEKDLEKLLKVKKTRKKKATTSSQAAMEVSEDEDDEEAAEMEEEMEMLNQFDQQAGDLGPDHAWNKDYDLDSDLESTMSQNSKVQKSRKSKSKSTKGKTTKTIIQDSDWDDAIEL
jgi:structure-specific endonuclease subunit SLX1